MTTAARLLARPTRGGTWRAHRVLIKLKRHDHAVAQRAGNIDPQRPDAVHLELEADLIKLIADEPDFDKLRGNPDFQRLILKSTPQT